MNDLPNELIQYINKKLDFFDQLSFKGISQGFYECIRIKQHIPYLLTMTMLYENEGAEYNFYKIGILDCFRLDKFYLMAQDYIEEYKMKEYDVFVLNPNKYTQPPDISEFEDFSFTDGRNYNSSDKDYALKYGKTTMKICFGYRRKMFLGCEVFNMKTFIKKCIDIANKKMNN